MMLFKVLLLSLVLSTAAFAQEDEATYDVAQEDTAPSQTEPKFQCRGKTKCAQMNSCAEAQFYLKVCGVGRLDRDKDGVACETLC